MPRLAFMCLATHLFCCEIPKGQPETPLGQTQKVTLAAAILNEFRCCLRLLQLHMQNVCWVLRDPKSPDSWMCHSLTAPLSSPLLSERQQETVVHPSAFTSGGKGDTKSFGELRRERACGLQVNYSRSCCLMPCLLCQLSINKLWESLF